MAVTYHLNQFPPKILDLVKLIHLIGPAQAALARYDGILQAIPNPQVLLSPLTNQEAVLSSRIEGTQATLGEVLRVEAGDEDITITPEKRNDAEEILNYRKALWGAVNGLERLPLSQRLLKECHSAIGRPRPQQSPWPISQHPKLYWRGWLYTRNRPICPHCTQLAQRRHE